MNRYEPALSSEPYQSHEYAVMDEDVTGEYVRYDDYELLEVRIAELEGALTSTEDMASNFNLRNEELEGKISNVTNNAKEVLANGRNTQAVRRGFEMSGYVKHYIISREDFNSLKEKGNE
jgi:phage shock protein A